MTDLQIRQANDVLQFVAGQNKLCTRDDIRIYMTESCGYGINDILFAIGILCQYNLIENYQNRKLVFMITPEGMTATKVGFKEFLSKKKDKQNIEEKQFYFNAKWGLLLKVIGLIIGVIGIIISLLAI